MAELRSVDPRTLKPNPNNPRKTPAPQAMDDQLLASITAIGIIQPPVVREVDGDLVIKAGERRVKAAIRADMPMIDVLVRDDRRRAGADGIAVGEPRARRDEQRRYLARDRAAGEARAGTSKPSPTRSRCRSAPSNA